MAYSAQINRANPACVLFLIDRSGSMSKTLPGDGRSLAQGVADAVNKTLYELVMSCIKDHNEGPRHYFDVGLIGYGMSGVGGAMAVEPAFGGPLAGRGLVSIVDVANNPLAVDGAQGPRWLEPCAGYATPMCGAIELAGSWLAEWINKHPTSYAPIIVNITDGDETDTGSDGSGLEVWAERLRGLQTADGNVLLFNVFMSADRSRPALLPADNSGLPSSGKKLFGISSELPDLMLDRARKMEWPAVPGSRGLVYGANTHDLVNFLIIGTTDLAAKAM